MGRERYPVAKSLLITADGGGSNGSRVRLWKLELQKLADELDIPISVSHLPPGIGKWNKIEHRLFSFITRRAIYGLLFQLAIALFLLAFLGLGISLWPDVATLWQAASSPPTLAFVGIGTAVICPS
jgi:hypothetical protein